VIQYQDYLYVAAEEYGVQIIDFSNPSDLELLDIFYPGGEPTKIAINDHYMYISLGVPGIAVYDILLPETPQYLFTWNETGGNAKGIFLYPDGQHLLVSDFASGAHILSLEFPNLPQWINTVSINLPYVAVDVCGENDYGVCSYMNYGLQTFDLFGNVLDTLSTGTSTLTVFTYNGYSYVCKGDSGLKVVDTSSPDSMSIVYNYWNLGQLSNSVKRNNLLYIANSYAGIYVMNISDRSNPFVVDTVLEEEVIYDVILSPDLNYLYAADMLEGVRVFDLSQPQHPNLINTVTTEPDIGAHSLEIFGNTLFLAVYNEGFNAFDITDPTNPVLFDWADTSTHYYREIEVTEDGQHLFACAQNFGILIYTIYGQDSVHYEYTLDIFNNSFDIAIDGDYAYIAAWDDGLYVMDISNYAYVFKIDSLPADNAISSVSVLNDNYLAMSDWAEGFAIVDISDPEDLSEVDRIETPGLAKKACFDGRYIYLCDHYDFSILDMYSGMGIEDGEISSDIPSMFRLNPVHPNPFNAVTNFSFQLAFKAQVSLQVFNTKGEWVRTICDTRLEPGEYRYDFDAGSLSSGLYFVSLKVGNRQQTQKFLLLR
jgi:hypothetical protein